MKEKEFDIIEYSKNKVVELFKQTKVPPGHGLPHVLRVTKHVKEIAKKEKAKKSLLCELSALFHDIGRIYDKDKQGIGHQEMSYKLLKKWFKEDKNFGVLSKKDKIEILYAVRNHGCDSANKYDTAYFLRDADKIDGLDGNYCIQRHKDQYKEDPFAQEQNLRFIYQIKYFIRTKTAKEILHKSGGWHLTHSYFISLVKKREKSVTL